VPAVCVVTEAFVDLARTAARAQGRPDLRLVVLPHPFETRPPATIAADVAARLDALGALLAAAR
jgi:hypothetical protein